LICPTFSLLQHQCARKQKHIGDNIDRKNHQNNSDKHNVALVSKEIAQDHYNDIYSIFTDENQE